MPGGQTCQSGQESSPGVNYASGDIVCLCLCYRSYPARAYKPLEARFKIALRSAGLPEDVTLKLQQLGVEKAEHVPLLTNTDMHRFGLTMVGQRFVKKVINEKMVDGTRLTEAHYNYAPEGDCEASCRIHCGCL